MSQIKVTALEFEGLCLSPETPVPVQLSLVSGKPVVPVMFPPEWSGSVTLRTRWQTDVTKPSTTNKSERWSLNTRPVREQEVTLLGLSREESSSMQLAALQASNLDGFPVPIYCDVAFPTGSSGVRIFADFRYRRFFPGGRVLVMPSRAVTAPSDLPFFCTVVRVLSDSIEVDSVPRSVGTADLVFPCFDSMSVHETEGEALAQHVVSLSMSWKEISGESTLPGLWPASLPDNAELISPICQVVDGFPLFPFSPNWADQVTVSCQRDFETELLGRADFQDPMGKVFHTFKLSLMGASRKETWPVLRFFDSMQGRRGCFLFEHPNLPWLPFGNVTVAVDHCRILPTGDPFSLQDNYDLILLTRSDGTKVLRTLDTVQDNGSHFVLSFTEDLPDTDFVSAQPAFRCFFSSDSIEEVWGTDEVVPALELEIEEDRGGGPSSLVVEPSVSYVPGTTKITAIEGSNLVIFSGGGLINSDSEPAQPWPGRAVLRGWYDVSRGAIRQFGAFVPQKKLEPDPSYSPAMVRFYRPWQNNTQPAVIEPGFDIPYLLDSNIPYAQRTLWGLDGWTMCVCFTPSYAAPSPQVDRPLLEVRDSSGEVFSLLWDSHTARAFANRTGVAARRLDGTLVQAGLSLSLFDRVSFYYTLFVTVRVSPLDGKLRVWVNGQQATSSAVSFAGGMSQVTTFTTATAFKGLATGGPAPSPAVLTTLYGGRSCANSLISFPRPLSEQELDDLHQALSEMYSAPKHVALLY